MLSFVIPAYNEQELIADCILSICVDASVTDYEIIVVDNNSTDNTAEVARGYGATVITESRKGTTWARQAGLEATKYDLVAFIDADSTIPRGWTEIALKEINKVNIVAVSGPTLYLGISFPKNLVVFFFYCIAKVLNYFFPFTHGGNVIVKKQALKSVGGFNTSIEFYGDDTATAVRLVKVGVVQFSLDMYICSSPRRFEAEGMMKTGFRYVINYAWIWLTGHPFTVSYHDIRK